MGLHIPSIDHAEAAAKGAAVSTAIIVPSIAAGDSLLAVIVSAPVASVAGLDPAAFAVSAGSIQSATVDTSGKDLVVIHTRS